MEPYSPSRSHANVEGLINRQQERNRGLLVPWGIFKPPWKEGHAFYFNLLLYGVYCALTVAAFWAALQMSP
jgi:hypothetical protein